MNEVNLMIIMMMTMVMIMVIMGIMIVMAIIITVNLGTKVSLSGFPLTINQIFGHLCLPSTNCWDHPCSSYA